MVISENRGHPKDHSFLPLFKTPRFAGFAHSFRVARAGKPTYFSMMEPIAMPHPKPGSSQWHQLMAWFLDDVSCTFFLFVLNC